MAEQWLHDSELQQNVFVCARLCVRVRAAAVCSAGAVHVFVHAVPLVPLETQYQSKCEKCLRIINKLLMMPMDHSIRSK